MSRADAESQIDVRKELAVMRTYIRILGSGALTVVGLGATIIVHGGWQAAAAGFAISQGVVFALTFLELRQASDRPRPGRPAWALGEGRPLGVSATTVAEPARAPVPGERAERPAPAPRRRPSSVARGGSA
jgi:hypothetical protein